MADKGYNIGELGLFLTLAFIIPGVIFLFLGMVYFGDIYNQIAKDPILKDSFVFQTGLVIVVGLLMTSICWSTELFLRYLDNFIPYEAFKFKKYFPDIGFEKIPSIQAKQKESPYLHQLTGQAIMHLNLWLGTGILLICYIIYNFLLENDIKIVYVLFGLIIIIVNIPISKKLFAWSREAIDKLNE
jgi:hypothetical protein